MSARSMAASSVAHPLLRAKMADKVPTATGAASTRPGDPLTASPGVGAIGGASVPSSSTSGGSSSPSLWSRYMFAVNVVFENIDITAGLSSKKTAMPVPAMPKQFVGAQAQAQMQAAMAAYGMGMGMGAGVGGYGLGATGHAPTAGFSMLSPRGVAGRSSTATSGAGTSASASGGASSDLSHSLVRAAYFQPVVHVSTGTFSLSLRYKPNCRCCTWAS